MISLLLSCRNKKNALSANLASVLHDGMIFKGGCLFLKNLYEANKQHVNRNHFDDLTGVESFINGFIINDFCSDNYLKNSLLFIDGVSNVINESFCHIPTEIVLCKSYRYYHFMMHTIRATECPYLENDLESYIEPTIVVRLIPTRTNVQ